MSRKKATNNILYAMVHQQDKESQTLRLALMSKEQSLSEMETRNEMLEQSQQDDLKHDELMAAIESDKVAASRAMAQNAKLKDQLEELELAVIQLVRL